MQCIVVNDEPIALEGMSEYVKRTSFLTLVAKCSNAFEAIEIISENNIDLVFLDINMPGISGLDMIKTMSNPPMVIFTTAYSEYAIDGFELNAIDYILKPISYSKFLNAAQKALRLYKLENQESDKVDDFIYIKVDKKLVKVELSDILFIESLKDYVLVHTTKGRYTTYLGLNKLISVLPDNIFVQVHKSFVISSKAIDAIDANTIIIGDATVPIGRAYKTDLFQKIINSKYLRK